MVARLGGDEFVVVVHDIVDAREIEPIMARMAHEADTGQVPVGEHVIRLRSSTGAALLTPESRSADALRHADGAMYQAKREGRHHFVVYQSDEATISHVSPGTSSTYRACF